MTSQPRNESELQLYRVLQRANLLSYYDTFIAQGGDDVHQVSKALPCDLILQSQALYQAQLVRQALNLLHCPVNIFPQLCEAGEEEFLEIMALVGMASKPLHVRRLQKALQDWVQNPGRTTDSFRLRYAPKRDIHNSLIK